ncbi:MAG: B12-binding domain-containing radical SAM protein [Deltaproteobacteria bacterium]|nr:B12-binding domain-containing radical SAM protein [Deltaproteobacteria bacterium]
MNALFIYPEIPDTFWSFKYALKYVSKKAAFPPLGLLTIAAMAPDTWDKRLVDMNVRPLADDDLKWAGYAFISAMLVQKQSTIEVINRCKAFGVKIVCGGPYFTTGEDNFSEIDHLVLNEGEITFPMFLEDIAKDRARHIYTSTQKPDLSLAPVPAWDLINLKDYDSMLVQFSRGCPFDCEFCDITLLNGRRQRTKPASQFIREIDHLYQKGWRGSVFVVDDNFIGVKPKVKGMLRELGKWMDTHGRPFHFFTEASLNLADDQELMDLMAYAGFNKVFVGVESPNKDSLKEMGKVQNMKRDLLDSVRIIQKNGMEVMGGFIIGFDSDPTEIFDIQIDFIQSSGITMAMVGLLAVLPGTRLYKRLQSQGRVLIESSGNNTDGSLNFIPKMDRAALIKGYYRVLETVYSPEAYYERCIRFLKNYNQKTVSKIDISGIKALFKSIWHIGIKNECGMRPYYWKLLLKSLLINPKTFGEAVRMAIVGIHFMKSLLKDIPDADEYEFSEESYTALHDRQVA